MKCTKILLYNLASLRVQMPKGLSGDFLQVALRFSVCLTQYTYSVPGVGFFFYVPHRCIHQCCKQAHTDWKKRTARSVISFFFLFLISPSSLFFVFFLLLLSLGSQSCWDNGVHPVRLSYLSSCPHSSVPSPLSLSPPPPPRPDRHLIPGAGCLRSPAVIQGIPEMREGALLFFMRKEGGGVSHFVWSHECFYFYYYFLFISFFLLGEEEKWIENIMLLCFFLFFIASVVGGGSDCAKSRGVRYVHAKGASKPFSSL